MPGLPPPVPTEKAAIRAFLAQQHDGIRGAAHGLTDLQAHSAPCTSAISIAGLVKHLTVTEASWVGRAVAAPAPHAPDARPLEEAAAAYGRDWDPEGETLAELMVAFDAMTARSEALVDELDLDTPVPVPRDAPWFPKDVEAWSVRWVWFHLIEEVARHAGHGDIVRESLDGATMYELLAGREGWPATPWLSPW
ncbi:MAG: DinB family protein, partial [Actinomycetota bacterium]|nr:DinB family protein [Actinomycetota bacterium]